MITEPLSSFCLTVRFDEDHPVVHVRGEVDLSTAPELEGVLLALIDRGHPEIVLDLGALEFIDGIGLTTIARSASKLASVGGWLTIRAPSRDARRLLESSQLGGRVRLEPPPPADDHDAIAGAAQIPAVRDVVQSALLLVVGLAVAAVDGADGVTVSLAPHGPLAEVIAVDPDFAALDWDQYAVGEGPCKDAAEQVHRFHIAATAEEDRWPAFVPLARARGVNSILSTPVRGGAGAIGALNMYSLQDHGFSPRDHETAELLARGAADVLDRRGAASSEVALATRVREAVATRHTIALAQGILIGGAGMSVDDAYAALREESIRTGHPLRDIAAAVLAASEGGAARASVEG